MVNIDIPAITARYLAGESIYALSKEVGISHPTLKIRLREAGVRIRSRKVATRIRSKAVTRPAGSKGNTQ